MLLSAGYKVIDTDKINHYILASDYNVIKEIKSVFCDDDILDDDGNISRRKLGDVVFYSDEKRKKLEQILHKKIIEKANKFLMENSKEDFVFVSVPLLFEANMEHNFDKIIFVSADEDIRLKRLMARNNFTKAKAKKRINSQQTENEKIKKSDFIIFNNSDFINLRKQVNNILEQLTNH